MAGPVGDRTDPGPTQAPRTLQERAVRPCLARAASDRLMPMEPLFVGDVAVGQHAVVRVDAPAWATLRMIAHSEAGAVVVVDRAGTAVGIVTTRDILGDTPVGTKEGMWRHPSSLGVRENAGPGDAAALMQIDPGVHVSTSLSAAARRFLETGLTHLAIVDDSARPIGIVRRSDLAEIAPARHARARRQPVGATVPS